MGLDIFLSYLARADLTIKVLRYCHGCGTMRKHIPCLKTNISAVKVSSHMLVSYSCLATSRLGPAVGPTVELSGTKTLDGKSTGYHEPFIYPWMLNSAEAHLAAHSS